MVILEVNYHLFVVLVVLLVLRLQEFDQEVDHPLSFVLPLIMMHYYSFNYSIT
jgi:hypothetical protein